MKKILNALMISGVLMLAACGGSAHAASPAYVSDTIIISEPSQGVVGYAAIITDLGGATATINDTTPTVIGFATIFAPDYNSTAKVFNVYLFLTQAGASAYLTAHPSVTVGWYAPATRN